MPGPKRTARPYHHGDLLNACIDGAEELLAAEGPGAVTLRAVAERAGVSHNAPYRHFATKRDLLAAVAVRAFRRLEERVRSGVGERRGRFQRLESGCLAYADFALEQPARYALMFSSELSEADYPELAAARAEAFQVLVEELAGSGKAAEDLALAIWSALHGLVSLRLQSGRSRTVDPLSISANIRRVLVVLTGNNRGQAELPRVPRTLMQVDNTRRGVG